MATQTLTNTWDSVDAAASGNFSGDVQVDGDFTCFASNTLGTVRFAGALTIPTANGSAHAGSSNDDGLRLNGQGVNNDLTLCNRDGITALGVIANTRHIELKGDLQINERVGFYGTAPVLRPLNVPVTVQAIHDALVTLGLITA